MRMRESLTAGPGPPLSLQAINYIPETKRNGTFFVGCVYRIPLDLTQMLTACAGSCLKAPRKASSLREIVLDQRFCMLALFA